MFTHTTPSSTAASSSQPTRDQFVMMGAAVLAFIASFLPWVSVSLGFISGSGNAWQSRLLAWASVLVCIAVGTAVEVGTFLGIELPALGRFAARHLLIGGAVLALALMVLRAVWLPSIPGVSIGLGIGFFIALIASLAQVICAVRSSKAQQSPSPAS